jgi:hypothetical protein
MLAFVGGRWHYPGDGCAMAPRISLEASRPSQLDMRTGRGIKFSRVDTTPAACTSFGYGERIARRQASFARRTSQQRKRLTIEFATAKERFHARFPRREGYGAGAKLSSKSPYPLPTAKAWS